MKNLLIAALALVAIGLAVTLASRKKDERTRRLTMTQNAAEWGCLTESQNLCGRIKDDFKRADCYNDALENCPKWALAFRMWIQNAGRQ